ncbi:uncharacterized protein LOC107732385 isoform X2 [Sinocyclocheilus rhinocerous]|uniref:uncharacterized protein LOC107732385 isoform X2 n=1 Tax=Sinocyclocheilus rhinocerous TaxID=307959 RepID=UPI0007B86630|nr:PREDICTED: uncharacterized protein LOC107732385 isoform X2 [Sinocyclocheilus rhinocerous]
MQTKRSTWTPLNHQLSNAHVFEERRNLLGKWFEKWTDSQRKQVLQDWFSRCSASQLKHLRQTLSSWVPEEALDFTRVLPRVISLYIFPFLDPRSLCRCAQTDKGKKCYNKTGKHYESTISLNIQAAQGQILDVFILGSQCSWKAKNQNRPQWAAQNLEALPANKDSMKRLSQTSQWNAGIRPGPVRPPVSRLSKEGLRASQRSHRSTPTVSLFEGQP